MNESLDIRPYQDKDLAQVIELWQVCSLAVPWNNPEKDIARKLSVSPDLFLVGEISGEIIASVMAGYEGHRGWINYLAVSPRFQRSGYGRQIMVEAEVRLKEKGCPKINLQVRTKNKAVISFYKSLGYAVDEVVSLGKRLEED
jgi:ribosomal protein S18 acetylase RimI-like enzyme